MSEATERRAAERRPSDASGSIRFGQEELPCRIIDLSDNGVQLRIDGKRASRNLIGKRASLTLEGVPKPRLLEGRVVWARPAVNGVYLGISLETSEAKPAQGAAQ
jgi:hypothetical protein